MQQFETIKCGTCGKEKIISTLKRDYKYKTRDLHGYVYFCSYTCYRRYLNKYKPPKKENGYYD